MKKWEKVKEHFKPAVWTLLCMITASLLYLADPLKGLSLMAQDLLYQRPGKPQSNIYVIGVDAKSLDAIGPWQTWPRSKMAEMVTLLNSSPDSRPTVIGIDTMYIGTTGKEEDTALAEAVRKAGNVITAFQINYSDKVVASGNGLYKDNLNVESVSLPYPALAAAAPCGFANVVFDSDGATRYNLLREDFEGQTYENFAYTVYQEYASRTNQPVNTPPVNRQNLWYVPYSAKPGAYGRGLSFVDVLNGEIPLEIFKDAIVIIGPYASGMLDAYYTPIDKGNPMYGAEVNANTIQALCEGNFKRSVPASLQAILAACAVLICLAAFKRLPVGMSAVLFIIMTLGWAACDLIVYRMGWILDVLYIPLFSFLIYVYTLVRNYLAERYQRQLTMNTFKRYVSPQIVEDIFKTKEPSMELGGIKRNIAVMFIDIRGFTPLSESLSPEDVVSILNEYLTLVTTMIFKHGGTLDKFIGDAAMALYNAPFDQEDYIYEAVATAFDIAKNAEALEKKLYERFQKAVRFGMGVNCGEAVVGNIGATFRMDYTAIGDTVNTAARLESNAKAGQVLISEHVYNALQGRIVADEIGTIPLKGKSERLNVFSVTDMLG